MKKSELRREVKYWKDRTGQAQNHHNAARRELSAAREFAWARITDLIESWLSSNAEPEPDGAPEPEASTQPAPCDCAGCVPPVEDHPDQAWRCACGSPDGIGSHSEYRCSTTSTRGA
jgi:hypothetical protein